MMAFLFQATRQLEVSTGSTKDHHENIDANVKSGVPAAQHPDPNSCNDEAVGRHWIFSS